MDAIKAFFRQYWPNLVAVAAFLVAVVRYLQLRAWEEHLVAFAAAAFGLVCVVASEEVAEWTGRYGFTRQQWWHYPPNLVRVAGACLLVGGTIVLFL